MQKASNISSDRVKKLDEGAYRWTKPYKLFLDKA